MNKKVENSDFHSLTEQQKKPNWMEDQGQKHCSSSENFKNLF